jgi:steroid delta-isomerase-like uncharacterized protein
MDATITTEGIAAALARHHDGYIRLDPAALAADYAEDCVVESMIAGRHVGRLAVERIFRTLFSAFPDLRTEVQESLVFGNRAVWTVAVTGTDNGGFMGLPPTGRPFSLFAMFLYTFGNDHQIVHERRIYDFARLLLHLSGETEPPIEGARLYRELLDRAQREHDLKIAAAIQRALLPQSRHVGTGFEVAATSVPCRAIGGDFFDYFTMADGTFAFVLGDVAGKGPPAALLAAVLQGIFTANAHRGLEPARAIREANDALVRRAIEARFATAVYGTLSSDGRLTCCNAGHNPPLLVGTRRVMRLETGGLVIGAFEQALFDQETLELEPGDTLVVYSYGMTEARNPDGEEFGEEQLMSCVRANTALTPTDLLECLLATVHKFSAGAAQSDDMTLLALRFGGR